jgi:hypothetical protein
VELNDLLAFHVAVLGTSLVLTSDPPKLLFGKFDFH